MLVVQEFVSIDGYGADANGEFSFGGVIADWSAIDADQLRLMERTGIIVLGRNTYEQFAAYWPTAEHVMATPINTTPKAVISQTLTTAAWGDWPAPTVHRGALHDVIHELASAAAPKDLLVWGSLSLTNSLLRGGFVDELRLIICPVALGTGTGITPADLDQTSFALVDTTPYPNGAVALTYRTKP